MYKLINKLNGKIVLKTKKQLKLIDFVESIDYDYDIIDENGKLCTIFEYDCLGYTFRIIREIESVTNEEAITEKEVLDMMHKICNKPIRNQIINKDDILNLRISLETCETFEQFLKEV